MVEVLFKVGKFGLIVLRTLYLHTHQGQQGSLLSLSCLIEDLILDFGDDNDLQVIFVDAYQVIQVHVHHHDWAVRFLQIVRFQLTLPLLYIQQSHMLHQPLTHSQRR